MATTPYKRLQAQCKAAGLRYKGSTAVLTQLLAEADAQANGQEGSGVCAQPLGVAGAADAGGTGDQEEAEAAAGSATAAHAAQAAPLRKAAYVASLSMFLVMMSMTIRFPFTQKRRDAIGCDQLCHGTYTSLRSGVGLVSSVVLGRVSDRIGEPCLWLLGVPKQAWLERDPTG